MICREMVPALRELKDALKDEPFELLWAISDSDPDYFRRRRDEAHASWPALFLPVGTFSAEPYRWHVGVWPTIYILDDLGFIRFKEREDQPLRGRPMEEAVRTLLAEMKGGPASRPEIRTAAELLSAPQGDYEFYEGIDLLETALRKYADRPAIVEAARGELERIRGEQADRIAAAKAVFDELRARAGSWRDRIVEGGPLMEQDAFFEAVEGLKDVATTAGLRTRLFTELWELLGTLEDSAQTTPVLGVQTDPAHEGPGARLAAVLPGTAAAKAGLGAGDVILAADGEEIASRTDLSRILEKRRPWDRVAFRVARAGGGEEESVEAVLGRRVP